MKNLSASGISRILNNAGITKAPTSDTWGIGFVATSYGVQVDVHYQDTNRKRALEELDRIVKTINEHKAARYWAVRKSGKNGGEWVSITLRAEESPFVVSEREVRLALSKNRRFYAFSVNGAGYFLEREGSSIRVTFRDQPFTTYAPETGGREHHMHVMVTLYAEALAEAGFCVEVDFKDGVDSVRVLVPRGKSQEEEAEDAKEPLMALREAVEADDLAYMTRKGGPTSLFVYFLVPFTDKLRRCEVFYSEGVYKLVPRFGGPKREFFNLGHLVEEIGKELKV